jgi:DNA-binding TFAR19-related protein (PDSD5 family)
MTEDDTELEQLKKKRLAEMQKNISFKKQQQERISSEKTKPTPRELLVKYLGYRGMEVLQNAESQFPNETKIVIMKLAELIESGDINEKLDGGKLLALFRIVGLNVHMQTTINVEQDGKFVSLSEKLSKKSSIDENLQKNNLEKD